MSVRVQQEDWETLAGPWFSLFQEAHPAAGPFVAPAFVAAWWNVFGGDAALELHSVRDGDTLIGVLPFQQRGADAEWEFIGNADVCDYMDILAAPGREDDVLSALLDLWAQRGVRRVKLCGLIAGSKTLAHLPAAAKARGWAAHEEKEAVCPVVPLAGSWEAYLEGLRGKHRHEIRRKLRTLLDGGAQVRVEVAEEPEDIAARLPNLLHFMAKSREDKAVFLTEQMAAYFRVLVDGLVAGRLIRIYDLFLDDRPVAAVLCLVQDDAVLLYNSGYDPAYRDLSVGIASKVLVMRDAIERGASTVNFLRGDEEYKFQLGARSSAVTCLRVTCT